MKKKGFTMVELLATITILGIIMLVAVPNVLSIIEKNKYRTYVEDAKKMQTLAEYKLRSDTTIERPRTGYSIAILLQNMDMTELNEGPEGGTYSPNESFVLISNEGGTYKYYITLREIHDGTVTGMNLTDLDTLNQEGSISYIQSGSALINYASSLYVGSHLEKGGTLQNIY